MRHAKKLFYNTLILTTASMLMRAVELSFQVFLSNKIGAVGIGLFQLIFSVQMLAKTLAISGIRMATTRLVSEEIGQKRPSGVRKVVRCALCYAIFFGILASLLLFSSSQYVAESWIGDARSLLSLRLMAVSLPIFAMSTVLNGYFIAVQQVIKPVVAEVFEECIRIGVIIAVLFHISTDNLAYTCAAVVLGNVAAEIFSFIFLFCLFLYDRRRFSSSGTFSPKVIRRLCNCALPIALSAYAKTILSTLQQMLVPRGLKQSGVSAETALAQYGLIHGMVYPLIYFPSSILSSLSELIIPDLTKSQVAGLETRIRYMVNRVMKLSIIFSIGVSGLLFYFHDQLGNVIYRQAEAGQFIMLFAPLIPAMYLDIIVDGMLKGLGQQVHAMISNIIGVLSSVILILILLPRHGIISYIVILYSAQFFNFYFSIHRLEKIVSVQIRLRDIMIPVAGIAIAMGFTSLIFWLVGFYLQGTVFSLTLYIATSVLVYIIVLYIFSYITAEDVKWIKGLFK